MVLTYAGKSKLSARAIADCNNSIVAVRSDYGDINWGRSQADTVLNPDIRSCTNKRHMRELFASHKVPMPRLVYAPRSAVIAGGTIIGRPDKHMKGRGYWKCSSVDDVRKALRGTRQKRAATHFMEFIDAPREYRVHIFQGKSIRISEKAHTAFHEYTTVKPIHSVKHVRRAAKQAVAALGLNFGAVDILANDTQAWVLEVNAAPGLGGSMPKLYATIFKRWERGEI